jgi:hypothetical protein
LYKISYQSLAVSNISQIGNELEPIHNLASRLATALDTKRQNTTKTTLQIPLRILMRRMRRQARVRDPRDIRIALEPLGQLQRILRMPLAAQTQRLEPKKQLVRAKGVQGGAEIAQDLDAHADGEGQVAKRLEEVDAVVAGRGLGELREARRVLAPVEVARVDDYAGDGCAVATDPFL